MAVNRGKHFEAIIREAFERVDGVSIDRIHDQTTRYKGSTNICDFIVYKKPYEYYIECKTVHGNTLPFSNITDNQWNGMLEKSKIQGVTAGVICWWIDKDVTLFIDIRRLEYLRYIGLKSVRYYNEQWTDLIVPIKGKKKRVFFEYDMDKFFEEVEK
jgi:hypothetical protein